MRHEMCHGRETSLRLEAAARQCHAESPSQHASRTDLLSVSLLLLFRRHLPRSYYLRWRFALRISCLRLRRRLSSRTRHSLHSVRHSGIVQYTVTSPQCPGSFLFLLAISHFSGGTVSARFSPSCISQFRQRTMVQGNLHILG